MNAPHSSQIIDSQSDSSQATMSIDLTESRLKNVSSDRLITSSRAWLQVGDVMNTDVTVISPDETIAQAAQMMSRNKISCAVVADDTMVVGILTETDIINSISSGGNHFDKRRVAELMSSPVESVSPSLSILEAAEITERRHIKRLPVLEDKRLVGIVTQTDIVRVMTSYGVWMDVADIMSTNVIGIQRNATAAEAADVMTSRSISCVVVIDGSEAVGILTERDIIGKLVAQHRDPMQTTAEDVMSAPVVSVPPNYSVFSASKTMEAEGIRRLVVSDGKRLCGIVAQTDIFRATRRKLQEEEDEHIKLLGKSENNLYTIDLDGNTTYVNPAFLRLFEVSDPHEFVGQPFLPERFWLDPADRTRHLTEIRQGNDGVGELTLKTSKGKRVYVTLFSTGTKNVRGEINGGQGILYDVTEKKELVALREAERELRDYAEALVLANSALEQSQKAAEAANRAKSEFLANMSHEIRTPMTAILGFADLLAEDAKIAQAPPGHIESVEMIRNNANHLLTIINDILDMSKIDAGKMTVERIQFNPVQIVEEVVSLLRHRAEGKGIGLVVQYDTPIPAHIESDPTRLRQILLNLVGNSVKFTEVGKVTIHVSVDPRQQRLCLRVVDTGIGMSPEQRDTIARFDAFSQADGSTTRQFGGTGLGLRISNSLAQLLGGEIEVQSVLGAGSTFTATVSTGDLAGVRLLSPFKIAEDTHQTAPVTRMPVNDSTGQPLAGLRLLLAEDSPANQRLISYILQKSGAQVTVAENGQIAIDKVQFATVAGTAFDVILMDMQMPELDGYAATRQLRQQGYAGPILALTAHAMPDDRQKCLDAGCDESSTKPIERSKLIEMIKTHSSGAIAKSKQQRPSAALVSELADDEEMLELVEMFVGDLPERVAAIEKAIDERDLETLGVLAHQMKGSAGSYGFPTMTDAARVLDASMKAGEELATIVEQARALTDLCNRACPSAPIVGRA